MYDPITEEISMINFAADQEIAEAIRTGVAPRHCCGAKGFGYKSWDRCPGCEWARMEQKIFEGGGLK